MAMALISLFLVKFIKDSLKKEIKMGMVDAFMLIIDSMKDHGRKIVKLD